jgi:hypothetical protein
VGFHILGATLVWVAVMHLLLRTREPVLSVDVAANVRSEGSTGADAIPAGRPGQP